MPAAPVAAVIYTHSHIDHVGGASVWAGEGAPIWATAALPEHLFKQYQVFLPIESLRGRRQFGFGVPLADLPCSGLGRRPDLVAARDSGTLLPTRTFSGRQVLDFGGMEIQLIEAHGETHDQLMVWIPSERTLLPGDNFYWTFPNLYTIRGTAPRPVEAWIESLDRMRALRPEHLAPSHTRPVHGEAEINRVLTGYRDAIQWVRDAVIRGANQGLDVDTLAETIHLPPHLAELPQTRQLYGQVDWSVRAIYANNLGWFDGRADKLYPLPAPQAAAREIEMMGGADKVLAEADRAGAQGEHRWAVHLLAKLRASGLVQDQDALSARLAAAYRNLAAGVGNSNGRGYLLASALELEQGSPSPKGFQLQPALVRAIPLEQIMRSLAVRLDPAKAAGVHECLVFAFPDEKKRFHLTVRHGVCEVARDEPLPGTPEPVATITMDSQDYRKMALKIEGPLSLFARGRISVEGGWLDALSFLRRFSLD